jgi:hypothetical protein
MPDTVFVTNRTVVQLPATPDNPDGGVVVLEPGLNEVPDYAAKAPFLVNLARVSAPEVKQAQADAEAAKKVLESQAQASQAVAEAQKANLDAKMKAGEDWAGKRQAAMDKGLPFAEPHPDPVTEQSIVLTSPPHVYSAAGFIGKAEPLGGGAGGAAQHAPRVTPDTGEHHGGRATK